jgi:hypothetical protein
MGESIVFANFENASLIVGMNIPQQNSSFDYLGVLNRTVLGKYSYQKTKKDPAEAGSRLGESKM